MKKRITLILVLTMCLSLLTGCFCRHETWNLADCVNPRTCAECGETEGAPLGHVWAAATCEAPKTCESCGETEGSPKGHSWVEATCAAPKNCTVCGLTEGETLEHSWEEATTEAPKTCALCALTEGERIITDPRFTTADTLQFQGIWTSEFTMTGEHAGLTGYSDPLATVYVQLEFTNDGNLIAEVNIPDATDFHENMVALTIKLTYEQLAAEGLDKDAVDELLKDQFGMDMDAYVRLAITEDTVKQLIEQFCAQTNMQGVYYVSNGVLYSGDSWSSTLVEEPYTLNGDTLVLDNFNEGVQSEVTFTRNPG